MTRCSRIFPLLILSLASPAQSADRPPNVVLILIDDLGWTDLGCQGSKFYETPHINRLAASGMRLTSGYSACTVCSPTRAAVMTGKYPARLHVTDWIEGPFFLYLPHYTVHTPLQAKPELIAKYRAKAEKMPDLAQKNPIYAAMIESLDDGIGKLLATLDELNLRENTIVVFTSDNGGLLSSTSNAPLRAGKGSAYEGGVRVPFIVSYPLAIAAGTTSDVPAMSIDLLPALVDLCHLPQEESWPKWDGVSIAPILTQRGELKRDALYWHYPHYHPGGATPYGAVRAGDFRLVEFYEDGRVELYNLKEDIGEQHDLASTQPAKREELVAMLQAWRKTVGAQMPTSNPDFDADKDRVPAEKAKAKKLRM